MKTILRTLVIATTLLLLSVTSNEVYTSANEGTSNNSTSFERNENGEILHTVKKGETVKDIAVNYGVPLDDLIKKNNIENKTLSAGDVVVLPKTLYSHEKLLLARLVHAEAKGESYKGKVAVATVILNRVDSSKFPDTVKEVIYAKGQFTPVSNGSINKPASEEALKSVKEAIALQEEGTKATFFYNPKLTNDKWIKSLKVVDKIDNHNFAIS